MTKKIKLSLLLSILIFHYKVESFENFKPESLSVFKDDQRVDHMLNLLTDVQHTKEESVSEGPISDLSETAHDDLLTEENKNIEAVEDESDYNEVDYDNDHAYEMNVDEEPGSSSYMSTIRIVLRKGFIMANKAKNVFDTVQKVTTIYRDQRHKIISNDTVLKRMGFDTGNDIHVDPQASTVDTLMNVVLDPKSLSKIVEVSRTSDTEDEILEGITAVLLGSAGRSSGSALTLDPVTIIALLTLAAYLIRAVYQILANNTGRSFGSLHMTLPFGLSELELPEVLVRVHNYISDVDYGRESYARSLEGSPATSQNRVEASEDFGVLSFPGSVAAMSKLLREGRDGCIRLYVCEQLAHRSPLSYSIEDVLVAGMGYYLAEADLWHLLNTLNQDRDAGDACAVNRRECNQGILSEARQIRNLFTEATLKFLRLWKSTREAKLRSTAREAGQDRAIQAAQE